MMLHNPTITKLISKHQAIPWHDQSTRKSGKTNNETNKTQF